jgi:hypothetical protein
VRKVSNIVDRWKVGAGQLHSCVPQSAVNSVIPPSAIVIAN